MPLVAEFNVIFGDLSLSANMDRRNLKIYLISMMSLLAVSGIKPHDGLTWVLEVFPVLLAMPILYYSFDRFPLTRIAYVLIGVHAVILMVGGHYTYAQVPLGYWIQDLFNLMRNPYDRIGHVAQGFVPAILAREILLRNTGLQQGKMLFFIVTCVCLAISAFYEFIEWWSALILGDNAANFLGTQGDEWDTQWDMFSAFIGAILAQLMLGKTHDRQLNTIS